MAWARAWPAGFGVHAGTHDGITASAQAGLGFTARAAEAWWKKRGARAIALSWRGAGWCTRGRPVTGAEAGAQAKEERGKGGAAVRHSCRGAGQAGRGRESCGGERREEEGKADKRAPLVSCPSGKVKGRVSA
jgi:hypothetical protein